MLYLFWGGVLFGIYLLFAESNKVASTVKAFQKQSDGAFTEKNTIDTSDGAILKSTDAREFLIVNANCTTPSSHNRDFLTSARVHLRADISSVEKIVVKRTKSKSDHVDTIEFHFGHANVPEGNILHYVWIVARKSSTDRIINNVFCNTAVEIIEKESI